jgi:hypothetical protein
MYSSWVFRGATQSAAFGYIFSNDMTPQCAVVLVTDQTGCWKGGGKEPGQKVHAGRLEVATKKWFEQATFTGWSNFKAGGKCCFDAVRLQRGV